MLEAIISDLENNTIAEQAVVSYRGHIAATLARLYTLMGELETERAQYFVLHEKDYGSHARTERYFEATDRGETYLKTRNKIKGLQALSDALEAAYWDLNREKKEASRL